MATPTPRRRLLPVLLAISHLSLAQTTVSIKNDIPSSGHHCVSSCIYYPALMTDIGSALACGWPYENECFCATATASASAVSKHINSCASEWCYAGDVNRDISSMQSVYAGYCMDAGFTQPIVSEWYTTASSEEEEEESATSTAAEPSGTTDPGPAETTTRLTLVTQTTDDGAAVTRGELFLLGAVLVPAVVLQLL